MLGALTCVGFCPSLTAVSPDFYHLVQFNLNEASSALSRAKSSVLINLVYA